MQQTILRSDLVDIIVATAGIGDDIRYGERVTALHDSDAGIDVDFASGQRETYDVVVAADGLRSATRTLILGEEITPVPMGLEMSYFTIDRTASDDDDWRWYWAPGRRSASVRPDPYGNIRAILSRVEDNDARQRPRLTIDEQKKHLLEVFSDVAWEVPRILDALRSTDDFYFESLAQVKIDRPWWSERGVLLGDAAYCASPVSGMGTTLALVGAYVLGAELIACDDPADAYVAYERIMRPFVAQTQNAALGGSILRYPQSVAGVILWNLTVAVLFSPPMRKIFSRFSRRHVNDFQLPDYPVGSGGS